MEPFNITPSTTDLVQQLDKEIKAHEKFDAEKTYIGHLVSWINPTEEESLRSLRKLREEIYEGRNNSINETLIQNATESIDRDHESVVWQSELTGYVSGVLKSGFLFGRGKYAARGAALVYGLDQAKPSERWQDQAIDAGLGVAKGLSMKAMLTRMPFTTTSAATNGVLLGMESRFLDGALSRDTYAPDPVTGAVTFGRITESLAKKVSAPELIAGDALTFMLAGKLFRGINTANDGILSRSPALKHIATASTFGFSTGMSNEVLRQMKYEPHYDFGRILKSGATQGALDTLAAIPGGWQVSRDRSIRPQYSPHKPISDHVNFNRFTNELVDWVTFDKLQYVGLTPTELSTVRGAVNANAQQALPFLIEAIQSHRVLAIGENHAELNPGRQFGTMVMTEMRKAGATHFAIEAPGSEQPTVDAFCRGEIDGPASNSYNDLLTAARDSGLKIVAVDKDISTQGAAGRDAYMANEIQKILDADPNNKVVFWVGGLHLADVPSTMKPVPSAATILKATGNDVLTVNTVGDTFACNLSGILSDIRQPIAVSMKQVPDVGNLFMHESNAPPEQIVPLKVRVLEQASQWMRETADSLAPKYQYNHWDAVIAFPSTGTSRYSSFMTGAKHAISLIPQVGIRKFWQISNGR